MPAWLDRLRGRSEANPNADARTAARGGKAKIVGRVLILKPFMLRYDGAEIFIADERVLTNSAGERIEREPSQWPAVLGDYHPGHTYALTAFNAPAMVAAHRLGLCVVMAGIDNGLTIT